MEQTNFIDCLHFAVVTGNGWSKWHSFNDSWLVLVNIYSTIGARSNKIELFWPYVYGDIAMEEGVHDGSIFLIVSSVVDLNIALRLSFHTIQHTIYVSILDIFY